jgi:type II secretory pathway component GspD/PulD (secretin)
MSTRVIELTTSTRSTPPASRRLCSARPGRSRRPGPRRTSSSPPTRRWARTTTRTPRAGRPRLRREHRGDRGLVETLDTRPTQVLVEATILQAQLNEANAFGVDFSLIGDLDFTEFLSPLAAANSLINGRGTALVGGTRPAAFPGDGEGRAVTTSVGNVTGPASLKAGIIDEDVAVFLRVLDEVTDVTVISNPKVLTLNRQAARVLVGTRVGYLNTTTTRPRRRSPSSSSTRARSCTSARS